MTFIMKVFHAQRLKNSTAFLFLCVLLLLTLGGVVNKANGLQMITQPDKTIVSSVGSNQTFVWNFILTEEEKAKELNVAFAHWSNEYNVIEGDHLITFVRKSTGIETVHKGNPLIARRLHWVGDLIRGLVAFQLTNVQAEDASEYGIRFRADGFPPENEESGFTLSVQDPPLILTTLFEVQDLTIEVREGDDLNITCHTMMYERSSLLWLKDNKLVNSGGDKFLFLRNVSRSQAGEYICVSLSRNGNFTSPVTAIDVLYPPRIQTHDKEVSVELLRGHSLKLNCIASGNPSPVIRWHKQGKERRETNKNSWNSSSLIVTPVNDKDFTSYACVATNEIGLDSVTFTLIEKEVQDLTIEVKEGDDLNITCRTTMDKRSSLLWLKDNKLVNSGGDKTLFLRNVSRSQAGEYICVSLSRNGNHTSPVTAIDVLYPPRIQTHAKELSVELLRGHSLKLNCIASGNPSPVIRWYKQGKERRETNKNSWNSSSLIVTPVNDKDFTSYACVATNKIGLDSVTFTLIEKADEPASESMSTTGTQYPGQTTMNARHHRSLRMYIYISGAVAVFAVSLVVAFVCWRKQRRNRTNCCTLGKERGGAQIIPLGPQNEDIETAASLQA